MNKKLNIAVVAGGDSSEYEISLKSGANVMKNLDASKFNSFLIEMTGGNWNLMMGKKKIKVNKNNFTASIGKKKIKFDCVFVAIHGAPGEDGKLQGYFDMLGIPYTTAGVHTLAVTFNKNTTKSILRQYGILSAESVIIKRGENYNAEEILKRVGLPCFVKPNNGGSSCGASKVNSKDELVPAIEKSFNVDGETIIEQYIKGTELTCGVIKYKGEAMVLPVTEIVSKKEFFDYEAKYTPGMSDEITPARISKETDRMCKDTSTCIFQILNCRGISRIDYILSEGKLYFLEVNTVPGLTEESIVPKQAEAVGIGLKELCTMVIEETLGISH